MSQELKTLRLGVEYSPPLFALESSFCSFKGVTFELNFTYIYMKILVTLYYHYFRGATFEGKIFLQISCIVVYVKACQP